MLFIPYVITCVIDNGGNYRPERLTELYKRIDTSFLDVLDDLSYISTY